MNSINLYHTSFDIIKNPDIKYGRKNADFGQGFYLSDNKEFSKLWSRIRKDQKVYINSYSLLLDDLKIKRFIRNIDWFEYIYENRNNVNDFYNDYDLIIGPIANDTIYDTWGILSSGILDKKIALDLYMIGPEFIQYVIKTDRALNNLKWIDSIELDKELLINLLKDKKEKELIYQNDLINRFKILQQKE